MALRATSPDPPLQKNTQKKTKEKRNKKKKKPKNKQKKYQKKKAFQLSIKFVHFLVAFQNFPSLTPWPKKRAPKNTIKIGVSGPFFEKQICVTKRPFLDQKTKIHKFQLSFFGIFPLCQKQKTQQFAETPIFIVF